MVYLYIYDYTIVHVIFDVIICSLSIVTLDVNNINEVLGIKTVNPELKIKYKATGSLDVVFSPTVDVALGIIVVLSLPEKIFNKNKQKSK